MAYLFNGSSDGFELPALTALGDFTIVLRCRALTEPGSSNAAVIAWDNEPTSPREAVFFLHDRATNVSGLYGSVDGTGASDYSSPNLPLNQDTAVVIRRTGTSMELWIDGLLKSSVTVGAGSVDLSNGRLGCHYFSAANSEFSNITAGQLAVYTSALEQADIDEHAAGATPDEIGTGTRLHYYPLEGDLVDVDGNGADLVAIGSPSFAGAVQIETIEASTDATYFEFNHCLTRASDGRLWASFIDSTARYVQVRYSDDDGTTWSSAITAIDLGATGRHEDQFILMGLDDLPLVFCFDQNATNNPIYVARYDGDGLGTFSSTSFTTADTNNMQRMHKCACVTSSGRWYIFYPTGTTSQSTIDMRYSDDDGATWSAATQVHAGDSSSPAFRGSRGSTIDVVCGPDDMVHISFGDVVSNNQALVYLYADLSAGAPGSLTAETAMNQGFGLSNDEFVNATRIALDLDGNVHIVVQAPSQNSPASSQTYQLFYVNNIGGSWNTAVEVAAGTAGENAGSTGTPLIYIPEDGIPRIVCSMRGFGANTANRNVTYIKAANASGTSWDTPIEILDSANEYYNGGISPQYTLGLGHTQLRSGLAFAFLDPTNSDLDYYHALPTWRESDFAATTTLVPTTPVPTTPGPFEGTATIDPDTAGRWEQVRQTVARDPITGRLWAIYMDATGRYVRYRTSDDEGVTWSSEGTVHDWGGVVSVHSNNICIDPTDGYPLVYCYYQQTSGGFVHPYKWNGSSWDTLTTIVTSANEPIYLGHGACVTSYGRFYFAKYNGTNNGAFWSGVMSDDGGTTWESVNGPGFSNQSGSAFRANRGHFALICDSEDTLHLAVGDRFNTPAIGVGVAYNSVDVSGSPAAGSHSWGTPEGFSNVATGSGDASSVVHLAIDLNGDVHLAWHRPIASTSAVFEIVYAKKTSGVWGSAVVVSGGGDDVSDPNLFVNDDGIPRILARQLNDILLYTADNVAGSSWGAGVSVYGGASDTMWWISIPEEFAAGLEPTQFADGYAFTIQNNTQTQLDWVSAAPIYRAAAALTTPVPTTPVPTTLSPTTLPPTTLPPTTLAPTLPPTTLPPTTLPPTTLPPTTLPPTTLAPTLPPTTIAPTPAPPAASRRPALVFAWKPGSNEMLVRAWVEGANREMLTSALTVAQCSITLRDLEGNVLSATGSADPSGSAFCRFTIANVNLVADAHYQLSVVLRSTAGAYVARGIIPFTTRR